MDTHKIISRTRRKKVIIIIPYFILSLAARSSAELSVCTKMPEKFEDIGWEAKERYFN